MYYRRYSGHSAGIFSIHLPATVLQSFYLTTIKILPMQHFRQMKRISQQQVTTAPAEYGTPTKTYREKLLLVL
jgi:hypothetical protein